MASKAIDAKGWFDEPADEDRLETGVRARPERFAGAWHLRCTRKPVDPSLSARLPDLVTVLPDGTAIAHYPGDGTLRFCDLAHVMAHHDLTIVDFEEQPSG